MSEQFSLESPRQMAEAVAPIFKRYGWTYWDSREPPEAERIEEVIRDLIKFAAGSDSSTCSIGRFTVTQDDDIPNEFEVLLNLGCYQQIPKKRSSP
jgi:hypothetical protein